MLQRYRSKFPTEPFNEQVLQKTISGQLKFICQMSNTVIDVEGLGDNKNEARHVAAALFMRQLEGVETFEDLLEKSGLKLDL